jgi:hypothetical protein
VECYFNTPANDDHLQNSILLIPKQALRSHSTYSVHVEARIGNQKSITRDWMSTTGDK